MPIERIDPNQACRLADRCRFGRRPAVSSPGNALKGKRDAAAVEIHLQDLDRDGLAQSDDLRRMSDSEVRKFRDVDESIEAIKADERTEVSDALHLAGDQLSL